MATQATAAQLETICQGVAQVTDRSKEGLKRTLRFSPDRDGMVRLEVRLGADDAALLKTTLDLAEKEETDASAEAPLTPSDAIDLKVQALVRIADAFVKGSPPEGRPGADRHNLTVIVREKAAFPEGHNAELPDHGSVGHIAKKCLERLCCDATLVEADTGRKQRLVSGPMRRDLLARDGGCRFPGCHQRKWVDAHHIIPWLEGGPTTKDNLVILCTRHHRLLHEGGYKLTGPASSMQFSRPTGQVIPNIDPPAIPRNRLPKVRAPKAPDTSLRPNYHYVIGAGLPRPRRPAVQHEPSVTSSRNAKAEVKALACVAPRSSAH